MHRTRIKICGIRDAAAARAVVEAGADALGLVFVEGSPRHVAAERAELIVRDLPAFVEPIGLFVDAPLEEVRATARMLGLRTVQLHGHESTDYARHLAPLRVIKSFAFDPMDLDQRLAPWREGVENLAAILLDAPPPTPDAPAGSQGGTGRRFDWHALEQLQREGGLADLPRLILAGGLTPDNVGQAIGLLSPFAVDVSSGVERGKGVKDAGLIRAFCSAAASADRRIHEM